MAELTGKEAACREIAERFKKWAINQGWSVEMYDRSFYTGLREDTYKDSRTQDAWPVYREAYDAGAKAQREQDCQIVQEYLAGKHGQSQIPDLVAAIRQGRQ